MAYSKPTKITIKICSQNKIQKLKRRVTTIAGALNVNIIKAIDCQRVLCGKYIYKFTFRVRDFNTIMEILDVIDKEIDT